MAVANPLQGICSAVGLEFERCFLLGKPVNLLRLLFDLLIQSLLGFYSGSDVLTGRVQFRGLGRQLFLKRLSILFERIYLSLVFFYPATEHIIF